VKNVIAGAPRPLTFLLFGPFRGSFDVSFEAFLRSPAYEAVHVGGEDGWLEGHVRFVLARAIARLVAEGVFQELPRAPRLHLGYAYPDSSDATIVAIVAD
jgi:hypothetical protein